MTTCKGKYVNIMPAERAMKSAPSSKRVRLPFEPAAEEQGATSRWKGPWWRPGPGEWPVLGWIKGRSPPCSYQSPVMSGLPPLHGLSG